MRSRYCLSLVYRSAVAPGGLLMDSVPLYCRRVRAAAVEHDSHDGVLSPSYVPNAESRWTAFELP